MIRAVLTTIAAVGVLGTGACSQRSNVAHAGERNPWTIPGTLRVGMDEEPDSLNPLFSHSASSDVIAGLVYSFLLRYDRTGNYVPDLATMVPSASNGGISRDGTTIVVHLRKNVRWADGRPLTEHIHLAFPAQDDATVRAFHAAALAAGYEDHGGPGESAVYHPGYYGAFVLDPDGHNIELVNHNR